MGVSRFDDIIGHAQVVDRLKKDMAGDRLSHAYLFVGPDGVGKNSVASLFGAAMLCAHADVEALPCGDCLACGKIARFNHPDFHVLETEKGKKWIRIEQVRRLQTSMALRPFESERRVIVVDNADRMNEAAQNAFLKTLEEPPPGTLIIMVAPGTQSLLPTIVSRCRIERFGPLKTEELSKILVDKRGLDENEANLIAGMVSGSVGAALAIDLDFVRKVKPAIIERIAEIASEKKMNPEKVFGLSNQLTAIGDNSLEMIRMLLKDVAFMKMSRSGIINSDNSNAIEKLGKNMTMGKIFALFDKTLEAEMGLSRNLQKSFIFENLLFAFAPGVP